MRKVVTAAIAPGVFTASTAGPALAGEVTGNGKETPIRSHVAASICSFSALEDWVSADPQSPGGIKVEPGVVQVPRHEGDNEYPPGVPGFACSPGRPLPPG